MPTHAHLPPHNHGMYTYLECFIISQIRFILSAYVFRIYPWLNHIMWATGMGCVGMFGADVCVTITHNNASDFLVIFMMVWVTVGWMHCLLPDNVCQNKNDDDDFFF